MCRLSDKKARATAVEGCALFWVAAAAASSAAFCGDCVPACSGVGCARIPKLRGSQLSLRGGGGQEGESGMDAFALMMQSQRPIAKAKEGTNVPGSNTPLQKPCHTPFKKHGTHTSLEKPSSSSLAPLQGVEFARSEMAGMGFSSAVVERVLKLHAIGARVDLAHAVASCITLSDADEAASEKQCDKKIKLTHASQPAISDQLSTNFNQKPSCSLHSISFSQTPSKKRGAQKEACAAPALTTDHTARQKADGGNLCRFLGVADRSVPPYFFLDWSKRSAHFLHAKPENAKILGTVKWRQVQRDIFLCTDNADTNVALWHPQTSKWNKGHEQLLKSHLQKCVRRSDTQGALESAAALLSLNHNELLQRLGVIIVEDAMLCSAFSVLLWLMAASYKDVALTLEQVEWVLGLVAATAAHPIRDLRHQADSCHVGMIAKQLTEEKHRSLLFAVLLRRDYKCMTGDKLMFNACATEWATRLKMYEQEKKEAEAAEALEWSVNPVALHSIKPLTLARWKLAAVDFHCSDIDRMLAAATGVSQDRVKALMWRCSSSVTNKQVASFCGRAVEEAAEEGDTVEWEKLRSSFEQLARTILVSKGIC